MRAKMEIARRAPGQTIDVGRPNESNRIRVQNAKERTGDRGWLREEHLAFERQTKTLIELSEALETFYDGCRPKTTIVWLFIRAKMYTYILALHLSC